MPVRYQKWITRADLRANSSFSYVFGDNARRVGYGGQAKEMRGEPNAIGVATLYAPGVFYDANPRCLEIVVHDLERLVNPLWRGETVIAPYDGLGTGLARLTEFRPDLHNLIVSFFKATPGEPCPWEYV